MTRAWSLGGESGEGSVFRLSAESPAILGLWGRWAPGHARNAEGARAPRQSPELTCGYVSPSPDLPAAEFGGSGLGTGLLCWKLLLGCPDPPPPAIPHTPLQAGCPPCCPGAAPLSQGTLICGVLFLHPRICSPHKFLQTPWFTTASGLPLGGRGGLPQWPEVGCRGWPVGHLRTWLSRGLCPVPVHAMSSAAGDELGVSAQVLGRPGSVSPQRPPGVRSHAGTSWTSHSALLAGRGLGRQPGSPLPRSSDPGSAARSL